MIAGLNDLTLMGERRTPSLIPPTDIYLVFYWHHRLFLDSYKIWEEQTVTDRVGLYRLTYAEDGLAKVLVNLGGHIATSTLLNAHVTKVSDMEISGYFDTAGRVWGGVDVAKVYFVVQFNKPIEALNGWVGDKKEMGVGHFTGSSELITVPSPLLNNLLLLA